jgi:hypothetical protein
MWRLNRSRGEAIRNKAILTVELFDDHVPARDRDEITAEATRVLAFAAPRAGSREVRFAPAGPTGAG